MHSSIYTTDNGDSLTLLSTGHISYSFATTHCNNSTGIFYFGDPALIASMFQIDASSSVIFKILFVHVKDLLNWITLTVLKAIAQDIFVARDGWNSCDQVRMSIEASFQPIYLTHLCALAKTMIDILIFSNFVCKMYYVLTLGNKEKSRTKVELKI